MLLLDLGENALDCLLLSPNLDVLSLGRLACSCKAFEGTLTDAGFLRRLTAARGFTVPDEQDALPASAGSAVHEDEGEDEPEDRDDEASAPRLVLSANTVDSLAALAVLSLVRDTVTSNHIVFHLASLRMVQSSKAVLAQFGELMKRFPQLRLRIDSHTGVGAPPPIAPQHSVQRARVVAQYLMHKGVPLERIMACAWGMDVGRANRWPGTQAYARAEVFLAMAPRGAEVTDPAPSSGKEAATEGPADDAAVGPAEEASPFPVDNCMPCWPSYYRGIEPRVKSIARAELSGDEGQGHEDGDASPGQGLPIGLLQIIAHMQGLSPGDVIALPGGQQISVQQIAQELGALASQSGGGSSSSDGEEEDEEEEEEEDEEEEEEEEEEESATNTFPITIQTHLKIPYI